MFLFKGLLIPLLLVYSADEQERPTNVGHLSVNHPTDGILRKQYEGNFPDQDSYRRDVRTVLRIMNNSIKNNQIKLTKYELWRKELMVQLQANKDYIQNIGTLYEEKYQAIRGKLDRVDTSVEETRHEFSSIKYDVVGSKNNLILLKDKIIDLEQVGKDLSNFKREQEARQMAEELAELKRLAMMMTTTPRITTTTLAPTTTTTVATTTTSTTPAPTTAAPVISFDPTYLEHDLQKCSNTSISNKKEISGLNTSVLQLSQNMKQITEGQAYLIQKLQKATSSISRFEYINRKILTKIDDLKEIYQHAKDEISNRSSSTVFEFLSEVDRFNQVIDNRQILGKKAEEKHISSMSFDNNDDNDVDLQTNSRRKPLHTKNGPLSSSGRLTAIVKERISTNSTNGTVSDSLVDSSLADLMIHFANKVDNIEDKMSSVTYMVEKHQKHLKSIQSKRNLEKIENEKSKLIIKAQDSKLTHLSNVVEGLGRNIVFMVKEIKALKESQVIQNEHITFLEQRFMNIPVKCARKSARKYGYHCYYIPNHKKNWWNAEHYCSKNNGRLAVLYTKEDLDHVMSLFSENVQDPPHWIGVFRREAEQNPIPNIPGSVTSIQSFDIIADPGVTKGDQENARAVMNLNLTVPKQMPVKTDDLSVTKVTFLTLNMTKADGANGADGVLPALQTKKDDTSGLGSTSNSPIPAVKDKNTNPQQSDPDKSKIGKWQSTKSRTEKEIFFEDLDITLPWHNVYPKDEGNCVSNMSGMFINADCEEEKYFMCEF